MTFLRGHHRVIGLGPRCEVTFERAPGVHKVIQEFHASKAGKLSVTLENLSGDWDLYVLGAQGDSIASSEQAQVLDSAEPKESVSATVRPHQRVQMVACNWLGEPEVTVQFEFVAKR